MNFNTYLSEKHANDFLKIFLVEECGMALNEFNEMSNDDKSVSVKEIMSKILEVVQNKLTSIDTSIADKSRGDIKLLKELPLLQDAITQLEALIERDENAIPEYSTAISTVIKSILYINQYSNVFKDAYRNKKSLMILKYESLILSIISSVSYIMSTIVDYKSDYLTLKRNVEGITNFAPLKSLDDFIKSVDSGEFKIITNDVALLREFYLEIPVQTMSSILEAPEYLPMVIDGIKNIYGSITNNQKISNLIYKAVGAVIVLLSVRDTFYTLFRMKNKISDMVVGLQNFVNINQGGNALQKLSQFANKFRVDAENGSELSKREVADENKATYRDIRQVKVDTPVTPAIKNEPEITVDQPMDDFFDF